MLVNLRLDKETEALLERAARLTRSSKSAIVKAAIREYCAPIVRLGILPKSKRDTRRTRETEMDKPE